MQTPTVSLSGFKAPILKVNSGSHHPFHLSHNFRATVFRPVKLGNADILGVCHITTIINLRKMSIEWPVTVVVLLTAYVLHLFKPYRQTTKI